MMLILNNYISRGAGEHGLGYDVMRLIAPYFGKRYHLIVKYFYSTLTLSKGLAVTRTIVAADVVSHPLLKTTKSGLWVLGEGPTLPGAAVGRQCRFVHDNNCGQYK